MPSAEEKKQREELENQVWAAISAFEQIVQAMPDDRVSLEALSHAYEQVGDLSRARDYLLRLAKIVLNEKDRDAAELLRERLARYSASDPGVGDIARRIDEWLAASAPESKTFAVEEAEAIPARPAPPVDDAERRSAHVTAELSFAWTLFQNGELNQEEYAQVAQDLSEISAGQTAVTVSVLHVLNDRGNRNMERILAFASRDSGLPVLPLGLFDVQAQVFSLLPLDFVVRYGAMPFETMGNELLVAVMNPYDNRLQAQVESATGKKCHFYLALPREFDAVVEKLTKPEPKKAEGAG